MIDTPSIASPYPPGTIEDILWKARVEENVPPNWEKNHGPNPYVGTPEWRQRLQEQIYWAFHQSNPFDRPPLQRHPFTTYPNAA